jgi:hypothetical protein
MCPSLGRWSLLPIVLFYGFTEGSFSSCVEYGSWLIPSFGYGSPRGSSDTNPPHPGRFTSDCSVCCGCGCRWSDDVHLDGTWGRYRYVLSHRCLSIIRPLSDTYVDNQSRHKPTQRRISRRSTILKPTHATTLISLMDDSTVS